MPPLDAPIPQPPKPAAFLRSRVSVIQYARRLRGALPGGVSDLSICDTVVNGAAIPIDGGLHAFIHPDGPGLVVLGRLRGRFCRVHAARVLMPEPTGRREKSPAPTFFGGAGTH